MISLPPKTISVMAQVRVPWPPRRSETEQRRAECELLCNLEVEYRKAGWGDPAYVHDVEHDLF